MCMTSQLCTLNSNRGSQEIKAYGGRNWFGAQVLILCLIDFRANLVPRSGLGRGKWRAGSHDVTTSYAIEFARPQPAQIARIRLSSTNQTICYFEHQLPRLTSFRMPDDRSRCLVFLELGPVNVINDI